MTNTWTGGGNSLALVNGKVYLERGKFAEAVLISGNAIVFAGSDDDVRAAAPAGAKIIDCRGGAVLPGFNDAHMHLAMYGVSMTQVNITDCDSEDELVRRCHAFIKEHPDRCAHGLRGGGWNQDFFPTKRIPTRHVLDKISKNIPVVLSRVCGHVVCTNTKAIEMAGLSASTPQPPDGSFGVEENGFPNGIFNESHGCLSGVIPDFSEAEVEAGVERAMKYAVAHGITSVQSNDARGTVDEINAFYKLMRRIYDDGRLLLRYRHQTTFQEPEVFRRFIEEADCGDGHSGIRRLNDGCYGEGRHNNRANGKDRHNDGRNSGGQYISSQSCDDMLRPGPLKLFKDGGLGGRTCYMRKDFLDDPGNRGISTMTPEAMDQFCKLADLHNIQVVTHVIGDLAADETLDSYEKVLRKGKNPLRHGLIHLQISDTPILERIAKYSVPVYYQPVFLQYELHIVEQRVGRGLASTSYAFGQADRLGIHTGYSSDAPVEDCDPLLSIYCAVTRQDFRGAPPGGFAPHQKVDLCTAIDAYTSGSAYCEFAECRKGRIRPGWLADITVFDRDIFSLPPECLLTAKTTLTVVDGKVAYQAP